MDVNQFFYRNVIFSKVGKDVALIDIDNPDNEKQVLDGWFGLILQLADGQHTIDELYFLLASKYQGAPPENLKETIHSVIDRMAESKLIVLTDVKTDLPYYLSMNYMPYSV